MVIDDGEYMPFAGKNFTLKQKNDIIEKYYTLKVLTMSDSIAESKS